jgi:hypothetical protein
MPLKTMALSNPGALAKRSPSSSNNNQLGVLVENWIN